MRDAAWLTLLAAVMYLFGLTSHGLTNWQEARRALVAREMFERGEWIVPTCFGEPYIAKPPMIYWAQMAIGHARSALGLTPFTDETEIRLAVALAGVLGVLATYFAARSILRDGSDPRLGDDAAWLSALGLATGVLYVRSSRIGELDVLTVPFVVAAVAAILHASRAAAGRGGTRWGAIGLATLASTAATLTKGPPALLIVALAGFGSLLLLSEAEAPARDATGPQAPAPTLRGVGALIGALAALLLCLPRVEGPIDWTGVLFFMALAALIGSTLARAAEPGAARRLACALRPAHPIIVLGVPVLVLWGWSWLVSARIGSRALSRLAAAELEDNLRLLVLDSPAKNAGFMFYGVAPMSFAALAGLLWTLKNRPILTDGQRVSLAWCGLGFAAFSAVGKGVARYLTPVWPGVAMLGGLFLAGALRRHEQETGGRRARRAAVALMIAAGLAQGWWYGVGREAWFGWRSPRAFMRELVPRIDADRLGVWELDAPAVDFYARQRVEPWSRDTVARLAEEVASSSTPYTLIFVEGNDPSPLLQEAGLEGAMAPIRAAFAWKSPDRPVRARSLTPATARPNSGRPGGP